ncbi:replication initiation and membrane attachment family protein [Jeotgalibaca sp. A127]|uniref:replication initiation and membrane attachment family protein n=1 Tax=Jeotgalibaca sp. A127 TaxID=3457324 RepID=UPI003FCEECD9
MNTPWKNLSPKDSFVTQQTCFISDVDKRVITFLYQPIIGSHAYSLYMTLLGDFEMKQQSKMHSELLATLNVGIPEFYQARVRLEGIGLLNTYVRESDNLKEYVYEPLMPVTSQQFFEEDLLRMLLREHVGESRLKRLQEQFSFQKPDMINMQKITQSFVGVYDVARTIVPLEPSSLLEAKKGKAPQIEISSFNFSYLKQLLGTQFFRPEALTSDLRKQIEVLNKLYGIEEEEMANLLLRATNLETGAVDTKELETLASDSTSQGLSQRVIKDKVEQSIEASAKQNANREAALRKGGYSEQEVQLVLMTEKLTPYQFIADIKAQKNGQVTSNEKHLLNVLLSQYELSSGVLNMLTYYMLVIQGEPTMNKGVAERIANDWVQSGVSLPEEAINKTKQFVGQKRAAAEKRTVRQYGRNVVRKVEKLPEWATRTQPQPQSERLLSEEEQKRFNERLKKFRGGRKAGDD